MAAAKEWATHIRPGGWMLLSVPADQDRFGPMDEYVGVPTAAAVFPAEIFRVPRAYAESRFNVVRYTRFDRGGHFAAMEEPDLLVQDVKEFFASLES